MTSPVKKTPLHSQNAKYHRTVFGNTSPNLINQSTNSIFTGSKGILSPNFNVVNSDWNSTMNLKSNSKFTTSSSTSITPKTNNNNNNNNNTSSSNKHSNFGNTSFHRRPSYSNSALSRHRTFGDLFNERYTKKADNDTESLNSLHTGTFLDDNNDESVRISKLKNKSTTSLGSSARKLRRTNTIEILDRFIPTRQSTSGKLSIEKTKSLPSFAMPLDHIESQNSKIYQNSVAEACGLEVGQRILQFQPAPPESKVNGNNHNSLRKVASNNSNMMNCKFKTRQMISTSAAQARMKKIPSCPEKVLDAPGLVDDFYLNLISWSNENILAIALNNSVYCWNATSGSVDLITECETIVTSIKWSPDDYYLSIGLDNGNIEIWDIESTTKLRTMNCGNVRIGIQDWNDHILTSGSRNGEIINNDVRISDHITAKLEYHTGEVCGLQWRMDGLQLASGGNDNIVNIWDCRNTMPIFTKTAHNAAVKAISWCPTQLSLLATGGGSACKKIHFWNSNNGSRINTIETDSQVSSLNWGYSNGIGKEIVSTHGFPNNEISVYSYPSLQKTGVIVDAHESRILNSQLSPNNTILATIAADENLKFWKLFDEQPEVEKDVFNSSTSGKEIGKVMTIR